MRKKLVAMVMAVTLTAVTLAGCGGGGADSGAGSTDSSAGTEASDSSAGGSESSTGGALQRQKV